jgi:hypothetical protein
MKTRLILVLAAVAMLFTACKKDNEIPDNTIVYDGVTYQMTTTLDPWNESLAWMDAHSENDEIQFMAYHVFPSAEFLCDKTYSDLTKEWPFFECYGVLEMNTEHGDLEGQHYGTDMEWGTVFESGTAKRTYSNNTLSLKVDATLKNGKKFALKLTVTSDWFHIDPNY